MIYPTNHQIADRIAELGLGVVFPGSSLDVTRIRQSVGKVLGKAEYLDNVRSMQKNFMRYGGAKEAADRIESFYRARTTSRPVQS
jgi:UDP:flavonoid glycosyltransferase YjiC (YdhE family)